MMFGKINRSSTRPIVFIVGIYSDGDIDLEIVEGNTEPEIGKYLSDVEWFNEYWYEYGAADIRNILPKQPKWGRYRIKGMLRCWQNDTPDDMDWEEEFVVLEMTRLEEKNERF